MQGRTRDTDAEDGLVDTAGGGEDGTHRQSSTDVYTTRCKTELAGSCLPHRELSLVLCDDREGWDRGWGGREAQAGADYRYIYIYMADSLHCTAKTNIIL